MAESQRNKRFVLLGREKAAIIKYYLERQKENSELTKRQICILAANIFSVSSAFNIHILVHIGIYL